MKMEMNPVDQAPTTSFSEAKNAEPMVADVNSFKVALFNQGGTQLGWLGEDSGEWAILVTDPSQALTLESYPYNNVQYYRIKGTSRYMSVSANAYIGFYNWAGATGWTMQGTNLVSDYNGKKLSLFSTDNGYLYAWNAYTVLEVKFEPIKKPVVANQPLTSQIEHIVVVMLENRSFDNVLGGLYPEKTKSGLYKGLKGDESNPLDPSDPGKGSVAVFQGSADDSLIMPYPDPGELFDDMNEQIFGTANPGPHSLPNMQGFAWNYSKQPGAPLHKDGPTVMPVPQNIMHYYSDDEVPMTWFLAKQFAVCDGWFASGPVQTLSNRMFAHCGTPGLVPGTNNARINNPDFLKSWSMQPPFDPPIHDKTIFELLDEAYPGEINWKVYYHDAPISALCAYVYNHWKWFGWDGGNVFRFTEHLSSETNFEYDIKNNRLPKYSFIEPRYTDTFGDGPVNSSHPGGAGMDIKDPNGSSLPPPISVKDGEAFLRQVYGILAKYPETFKKTLLIVIFDENGGIFDHVPPPPAISPFAQKVDNFAYDRYGVRIPALFISPCIPPGTIYPPRKDADKAFDHTSLISTICAQFGLKGTLTPRSAVAPTLKDLIPANPQVYQRPSPPISPVAEARTEAAESTLLMDVEAAMSVIRAQKHPHALAEALAPLLGLAQQARTNQSG